ncbi:MAG: hydantoinase/oxoprolinase family protein [Deltaproteobacteria bacterium]|nr:hydantoinase/oxoprolinase family protein [Deltaproteobacteria bacterium]
MTENRSNSDRVVGLGIDVGGTFSDSVLLDLNAGRVLSKAKSPTTHDDLVKGIERSVGLLDESLFPEIRLVSLSTTLATNALVEGRKSRIAAILPGYKPSQCPQEFIRDIHLVRGGHTAEGVELAFLDLESVQRIVEDTREKVEAYAISSYFSTRNPSHELQIKELVERLAPGKPVACGHDLSLKLNAGHRATTTILNAHLIPLIRDLLQSVKKVLVNYSIQAPLMVVKGDGSLFREEVCLERPVETILSGPAASVVGAGFLLKGSAEEAVVLDIGGTTTDIAVLKGGLPRLNDKGVAVGPWQTHVAAVDVRTVGLGGDSHIRTDHAGEIQIGPQRVEPLCVLGMRFPRLQRQLESVLATPARDPRFTPTAFWFRTDKPEPSRLADKERKLLRVLSGGPLNIFEFAKSLDAYPVTFVDDLTRLEHERLVQTAGFTPTDMFHIRGTYTFGNRECSETAGRFLAGQAGADLNDFLLQVNEIFNRKAALEMVDSLSAQPVGYGRQEQTCPACRQMWRNCFWERDTEVRRTNLGPFSIRLSLDLPLVGIGAPAHLLVPRLARAVHTESIVPENAEVANALGAIVGTILVNGQVLVRPLSPKGFACFTSAGKVVHPTLEESLTYARKFLTEHLSGEVRRFGGNGAELNLREERKQANLSSGQEILVEVILYGQAVAKPRFQTTHGKPS